MGRTSYDMRPTIVLCKCQFYFATFNVALLLFTT